MLAGVRRMEKDRVFCSIKPNKKKMRYNYYRRACIKLSVTISKMEAISSKKP